MCEPKIPGGFVLLSRKTIESEIWRKPPLYIKIWIYLLSKAQHSEYKKLRRGQLRTSIPEIMEDCSWYVGYRKVTPTKDQVFQVLEWLRKPCEAVNEGGTKATMITTTKATQGMIIEIDNYSFYQNSKNYESNEESNNENVTGATSEQRQPDNINKNDKNVKNDKDIISEFTTNEELKEAIKDFIQMRKQIKRPMTDKAIKLMLNKLNGLASTDKEKIQILNNSIENSWQGVFALKTNEKVVEMPRANAGAYKEIV